MARRRADRLDPARHRQAFEKYDIETIAPGYGCILRGRKVVEGHDRMLDEFLKGSDKSRMASGTLRATRSAKQGSGTRYSPDPGQCRPC